MVQGKHDITQETEQRQQCNRRQHIYTQTNTDDMYKAYSPQPRQQTFVAPKECIQTKESDTDDYDTQVHDQIMFE